MSGNRVRLQQEINEIANQAGRIEGWFPELLVHGYRITSDIDRRYNCIAWAASQSNRWWWPDKWSYWPRQVVHGCTLKEFEEAYATIGYVPCPTGSPENGYEKIGIFADHSQKPTHAARQLDSGNWTSKLGRYEDISHDEQGLNGTQYGTIAFFMKRPLPVPVT